MDENSDRLAEFIAKETDGETYHLIGHSLGSIIIRNGFKKEFPPGLGRIIMLAPPSHPPILAKKLYRLWPYRILFGDSGQRLASDEFYASLPIPAGEFGILAGDGAPHFLFGEPSDGIVTVSGARHDAATDFKVVPALHTFIMNQGDVFESCVNFLRKGTLAASDEHAAR